MATKLSPIDDIKTYRETADQAYARKANNGVVNPKRALAERETEAMGEKASDPKATAAKAGIQIPEKTTVPFVKQFSPAERAAQKAALLKKLQAMDAEDAKGAK